MKLNSVFGWVALILVLLPFVAFAQKDTSAGKVGLRRGIHYRVTTTNKLVYDGFVTKQDSEFVTLENRISKERWELRKSAIIRVERSSDGRAGLEAMGENPHADNYMLGNAVFPFRRHETTTIGHWFLFGNIQYAVSDKIAVTTNILGLAPVSLGIRSAFSVGEESHIGGSAFAAGSVINRSASFLRYGGFLRYTQGTSNRNMTFSAGMVGINSELLPSLTTGPFVNVGILGVSVCDRFRKYAAFNAEAWYLPERSIGIAGGGIKLFGDGYTCWTLGGFVFFNNSISGIHIPQRALPVPYFSVKRRF